MPISLFFLKNTNHAELAANAIEESGGSVINITRANKNTAEWTIWYRYYNDAQCITIVNVVSTRLDGVI